MSNYVLTIKQNNRYSVSMRIKHFFCLLFVFFMTFTESFTQESSIVRSQQAVHSDILYDNLIEYGLNPEVQLLINSRSNNFPYNILLTQSNEDQTTSTKNLILVFSQNSFTYYDEVAELLNYYNSVTANFSLHIVFAANDDTVLEEDNNVSAFSTHIPQGSNTYIQSLLTTENTAAIVFNSTSDKSTTIGLDSLQLFDSFVEVTPGSITSSNETTIVPLSFFTTLINSFASSGVTYFIKGYFLSLYRLNLIEHDHVLGTWLENEIPSVSVKLSTENSENVFFMLHSLIDEFDNTNFLNQDTNYSFFQIFSQTFFITEAMFLVLIIFVLAIVLFLFFNLSFVTGVHRHIHKKEFKKTWYLIPLIVFATGFFLFLAQKIIQGIIPQEYSLVIFSFILKIILSVLFLLLFSLLQHIVKLPLTGFIYAYTLSVSAALNILIFSLVEITLAPLFIGQYIVVQISQRMRRIFPIIICFGLMTLPYIPLVFNIANAYNILSLEKIMNASFGTNLILACFMLPFQIMIIRILTRLKFWGMRLKDNRQKISKQCIVVLSLITVLISLTLITMQVLRPSFDDDNNKATSLDNAIQISHSQKAQFGNVLQTLEIKALQNVIRYHVELSSTSTLPIYDANYPYDILSKPMTAVFALDDYPPNPLILNFTTQDETKILCRISAWIKTNSSIEKLYIEYTLEDES